MALETGTYISDLVSTNPVSSDNISQGDDHIRLLKSTIKATFPNAAGPIGLSSAAASGAAILSVTDNTNAALRITQLGTGNALVVEDSTNPDSTPFIVDASGNVGIGTTGPGGKLDVSGADDSAMFFRNTTALFRIRPYVTSYATTQLSALNAAGSAYAPLAVGGSITTLETSGIERMRIDSSGNVGIGGTPNTKLDVRGPSGITSFTGTSKLGLMLRASASTTDYTGIDFTELNGTTPYARIGMLVGTFGSSFTFGTSNNYANGVTNTAMTIDPNGNVGIGTTSPGNKLTVYGASGVGIAATNSTTGTGASNGVQLAVDSTTGGYLWNYSAGFLSFGTNASERMRINASGNVGIGTTDISAIRLFSSDSANQVNFRAHSSAGTYTSEIAQLIAARASGTDYQFLACYVSNAAAYAARIRGDGNLYNANGVYAAISDQRIKENIVDTGPKLDDMMRVRVRNYNLIGSELKQIGVVAQELETVFPGLVEETIDKDADGNELGTTTKSVKYSVFVPMLIKALQEANNKIDALEARIDALEAA